MANKFVCVDIHTVRPKDTLYSIAKKYGMNVDLLMRVNRVRNPYNLRVGTRLCIPGMIVSNDVDTRPAGNDDTPAPSCKKMHTVKQGDTLYMIAKMYKVTLDDLMDANPDIDPYRLHRGMEICIPN